MIIAVWSCLLCMGLFLGPMFPSLSNNSMTAPPGSSAHTAQAEYESRFSSKSQEIPVLVLVECLPTKPLCNVRHDKSLRLYYNGLRDDIFLYNSSHNNVLDLIGYYEYDQTLLDSIKSQFISSSGKAMFFTVYVRAGNVTAVRYNFLDWLAGRVEQGGLDEERFTVGLSGLDVIGQGNSLDSVEEIKKIDMIAGPIALLVLLYMIRSWRLLIIALFNIGTSILVSFSFMTIAVKYAGKLGYLNILLGVMYGGGFRGPVAGKCYSTVNGGDDVSDIN